MTELSSKLADAYREGFLAASSELADTHHASAGEHRTATMETWEREIADTIREIGALDFSDPSIPEPVRRLFAPITGPKNQTDFFFTLAAGVGLVFSGAQAAASGLVVNIQEHSMEHWGDMAPAAATASAMQVRGIIDDGTATDWHRRNGVRRTHGQALTDLAWNQLGASEVLDLTRRRKLTVDQARAILKLNGLPPDTINALIESLLGPIPLGVAIEAVTQSQITTGEFADLLPQYGIDPAKWEVIYNSAGATMPPEMAVRLFREGRMDLKTFNDILLESNLKNKYVPLMKWLQFRPPPMEQALRMRRHGLLEHQETVDILKQNGFEDYYAEKLVQSAEASGGNVGKDLSPSTLIDLYEIGKWTRPETEAALVKAGYDATEAALLMDIADARMAGTVHKASTTRVHTRYVTWKIERSEASSALDALKIDPAIRDALLAQWDVERELSTLHLTRADLKKAVTGKYLTVGEGRARLLGMGYEAADADLIVKIDGWESVSAAKQKDLTRADQVKLYKQGTITRPQLVAALQTIGYDANEAEQIAKIADGG